ncbi:MAG: hypothetical protein COY40_04960 [Alphaproteobacteria bacterium CG_4_10_14_0_8_um_filter_53_9]|nr:MAG: hypothetical protein COY40_04960 [Alphaproteobacteria bacterium CG_4_10_14_0_8_um_filter_53_9]
MAAKKNEEQAPEQVTMTEQQATVAVSRMIARQHGLDPDERYRGKSNADHCMQKAREIVGAMVLLKDVAIELPQAEDSSETGKE